MMNTEFSVMCPYCKQPLQEVETVQNGGITVQFLVCLECGESVDLVYNTLHNSGLSFLPGKQNYTA